MRSLSIVFSLFFAVFCVPFTSVFAQDPTDFAYLFSSAGKQLLRASLNGTEPKVLIAGIRYPYDFTLSDDRLYCSDLDGFQILSFNRNGEHIKQFADPTDSATNPYGMDSHAGLVYWADGRARKIFRKSIANESVETLVSTNLVEPRGVRMNTTNQKLYWSDTNTRVIERSNLNGSDRETVLSNVNAERIALFPQQNALFWTDGEDIHRSSLNGSSPSTIKTSSGSNFGALAIDTNAQKIYVADADQKKIYRLNIDGSNFELFFQASTSVDSLLLDRVNDYIYWGDQVTPSIQRARLSSPLGTTESYFSNAITDFVNHVALNEPNCTLYMTSSSDGKMYRVALDTLEIEQFEPFSGAAARQVYYDALNAKLYWISFDTSTLYRSNYDGQLVQAVTQTEEPSPASNVGAGLRGVAVNPQTGLIYFSDVLAPTMSLPMGAANIYSRPLDGTTNTALPFSTLYTPTDFRIDSSAAKFYYYDVVAGGAVGVWSQTDLDGSNKKSLLHTAGTGFPVDYDVHRNDHLVYWSDINTERSGIWQLAADATDFSTDSTRIVPGYFDKVRLALSSTSCVTKELTSRSQTLIKRLVKNNNERLANQQPELVEEQDLASQLMVLGRQVKSAKSNPKLARLLKIAGNTLKRVTKGKRNFPAKKKAALRSLRRLQKSVS